MSSGAPSRWSRGSRLRPRMSAMAIGVTTSEATTVPKGTAEPIPNSSRVGCSSASSPRFSRFIRQSHPKSRGKSGANPHTVRSSRTRSICATASARTSTMPQDTSTTAESASAARSITMLRKMSAHTAMRMNITSVPTSSRQRLPALPIP